MNNETRVGILIEAQDRATAVFKDVQSRLGSLDKASENFESTLNGLAATSGVVFASLAAGIGIAVSKAADMESIEIAFTTILKSADLAKKTIADLNDFAAKTPYQFDEIAKASKSLLAFGVSAKDLQNELKAIGDISSGVGAPIGEIAELYGKAKVQGRLFAEDINQLTGRGIPIIQELAKQFGVSTEQVRGLVESGKVGFSNLQEAFKSMTSEGGQFNNMMDAQSQSLNGLFSTLKDVGNATMRTIGEQFIPLLKSLVNALIPFLTKIQEWVKEHPKLTTAIVLIATTLAFLTFAVTTLTIAWVALTAVSLPLIGTIALIVGGIMLLIGIVVLLITQWDNIKRIAGVVWGAIKDTVMTAVNAIVGFVTGLWESIKTAFINFGAFISQLWQAFWNTILMAFQVIGFLLSGNILGLLDMIFPAWQEKLGGISEVWNTVWGAIRDFFMQIWAVIKGIFDGLVLHLTTQFNLVKDTILAILSAINSVWSSIWQGISDVFTTVWTNIVETIKSAVDFVADQVNRLISLINAAKKLGANIVDGAKSVGNGVGNFISNLMSRQNSKSVNDAIISPNGDIISRHPDDYLIATKDPYGLVNGKKSSGGVSISVNINGGMYLDQNSAKKIGDEIIKALELQYKY